MNDELAANNEFMAGTSMKISKYLSPQVYKSIFSGEKDSTISTERKKLTVFFSDIKDFTATTERMQPEELTDLLNEYFTEMSKIAEAHGATIDKFIGDAIVAFPVIPKPKAPRKTRVPVCAWRWTCSSVWPIWARVWQEKGLEHPFKARMGFNTGYCNVGNFGSDARMDYTIIGAEANLAARLESIAEPGGIVLSYETYAHVRNIVEATPSDAVTFKGIAREVVPYHVKSLQPIEEGALHGLEEEGRLTLDLASLDPGTRDRVRRALRDALKKGATDPWPRPETPGQ